MCFSLLAQRLNKQIIMVDYKEDIGFAWERRRKMVAVVCGSECRDYESFHGKGSHFLVIYIGWVYIMVCKIWKITIKSKFGHYSKIHMFLILSALACVVVHAINSSSNSGGSFISTNYP